jgi:hypothetical protein
MGFSRYAGPVATILIPSLLISACAPTEANPQISPTPTELPEGKLESLEPTPFPTVGSPTGQDTIDFSNLDPATLIKELRDYKGYTNKITDPTLPRLTIMVEDSGGYANGLAGYFAVFKQLDQYLRSSQTASPNLQNPPVSQTMYIFTRSGAPIPYPSNLVEEYTTYGANNERISSVNLKLGDPIFMNALKKLGWQDKEISKFMTTGRLLQAYTLGQLKNDKNADPLANNLTFAIALGFMGKDEDTITKVMSLLGETQLNTPTGRKFDYVMIPEAYQFGLQLHTLYNTPKPTYYNNPDSSMPHPKDVKWRDSSYDISANGAVY